MRKARRLQCIKIIAEIVVMMVSEVIGYTTLPGIQRNGDKKKP